MLFLLITILSLNISGVQAEKYTPAGTLLVDSNNDHYGFANIVKGVTDGYLSEINSNKASDIKLGVLENKIATAIINAGGWGCFEKSCDVGSMAGSHRLAYFNGSKLIVGCGNADLVEYNIIICIPNNTKPTLSANKSSDNWEKDDFGDITLTTNANNYRKYSWISASDCLSSGTTFSNGTKINIPGEGENILYLCAKSNAKNECSTAQTKTWSGKYKLDTIKSIPGDISFDKDNIKAQDYSYSLIIDNSGDSSPIKSIKALIEDENDKDHFSEINGSSPSKSGNNYKFSFSWGMKNVDSSGGDTVSNGARKYTIKVTEICDKAGNCYTGETSKEHNVYANQIDTDKSTLDYSDLTSGKVADGTNSTLELKLKDKYGNKIIPVHLTSGNSIDIKPEVVINYNNTLRKNQYNSLTDSNSAVYYNNNNTKANGNNITFNNKTDGDYSFNFNVYAPTNTNNNFIIYPIKASTELGTITFNNNINFNFKPLYTTEFSGEQTKGLVEGITQSGSVIISKATSSVNPNSNKLYLQKDGTQKDEFNGKGKILDTSFVNINTDPSILYNFNTGLNYNLNTLFTLVPGSSAYIDDIKDVQINSWVGYNIGSINGILYKGNSIVESNNQDNIGVKIYGNSNIDKSKQKDLTRDQDSKDVKNLNGNIDKASVKKIIRQNTYNSIKNINSDINGKTFGDIIYYDLRNSNNKIKTLNTSDLEKNKTIIVLGGNLYITGSSTTGNNFPGIIVLKDDNGKGGKLYIDPNVSRIDAAIYLDKSIMSYNSTFEEISPENGGTYQVLKNQLYIHGSVSSENTIGGSRNNPPVCPFYFTGNCDLNESQKYDLNYLRRGIENKANNSNYPVVIEYNSQLQLNPPALFSN